MRKIYLYVTLAFAAILSLLFVHGSASAAPSLLADSPGAAIQQALELAKQADPAAADLAVGTISADEAFALAYLRSTDPASYPAIALIVAVYDPAQAGWLAYAPIAGQEQAFNQALASVPEALMDAAGKAYYSVAVPAGQSSGPGTQGQVGPLADVGVANLPGHKLPWQAGTNAIVTQKDGSFHLNQIDFVINNNAVYASKPGEVIYVKESGIDPATPQCINDGIQWRKGNYLVIRHSASEYGWYLHFTNNGVAVNVGDQVAFGTYLGVQGRTGYTCGSTGIHLHFMASTDVPDYTPGDPNDADAANWPNPADPDAATWPNNDTLVAVDFAEVPWANIVVLQSYTSQNSNNSTPVSQLPAGAQNCAAEGAVCNFDGIGTVYYGAGSAYYAIEDVVLSTPCADSAFGDPNPAAVKACYVLITAAAPACPVATDAVNLYSATACRGSSSMLLAGLTQLELGTFNDVAQSLAIPTGWSARVYKNNSETFADSLCLDATDKNLFDNTYPNGGNAAGSITWVRVFQNASCDVGSAPAAFAKSGPADGATGIPVTVTLSWGASTGASAYEYCVDTSDDGVCANWITKGVTNASKTLTLLPNTSYYWQVRAANMGGITYANGAADDFWSFTTGSQAAAFGKASPANAAAGLGASPTLKWQTLAGASAYQVCWDNSNDDTCANWVSVGANNTKSLSGLLPSSTYYWQARATTAGGTVLADGGSWWSFSTAAAKPAAPLGVTASDGTYLDKVLVSWQQSAGATSYEVYRSATTTVPSTALASGIASLSYNDTSANAGKKYNYWVKACNSLGCSLSASNSGYKQVPPNVDLTVKTITLTNSNISLVKPAKLVVRVKNQGTTPSGAFTLTLYDGSKPAGCGVGGALQVDVASLAAAAVVDVTISLPFASTGTHNIYAMADPVCAISEINEGNNGFGPLAIKVINGP